ncbi:glucose-6-phosphate isomerase [Virgisporangium aurantiacum]|uniref:Glucose-6-phosphate isomerase n=1 Tax=Virgisporangium aurantiacum TaxID=175570 RepID=A0A8J3Z7Q5_9ACTN|nr:glucose-6-phosphate isomerase [Virgisporangium aurantiacum]GIJ59014.1 glucose-6-phosphate isomerase [Virgisporangium aurantiacum]
MNQLDIEGAAGLSVRGARQVPGATQAYDKLVSDGVAAKLLDKDPTLWGPAAEAESKIRLGWVDTHRRSRELVPRLAELRKELTARGLDHVVLAGMGGSSLAPEVITATLGVALTILDTTDPHQIRRALGDRLSRTVVVVASKSGSTVETDSHRRAYLTAFEDAGLDNIGGRFVVITDPGSPFEGTAREMGAHVVLADPEVGGRYSALTAFGLVPSALAGVNIAELLDQAEEFYASLGGDTGNPALALGAALGAAALSGRDKVALISDGTGITGLGDWAEQLIAESTGKDGRGILPVVVETPTSPGAIGSDVLTVTYGGSLGPDAVPGGGVTPHLAVNGPLGAQFLAWEFATAIAGRVIGINPFDQPNVAESKENTNRILENGLPSSQPSFTEGAIEVYTSGSATTVFDAVHELVTAAEPGGYVAVMAYLDRIGDAAAADVRPAIAAQTGRSVTFGWGPRFLHSTGQYHKGGPQEGAFLQITGVVTDDLPVPGRPFTFGELIAAQAGGDRQALSGRHRPLLHLHLTDRSAGIAQLVKALQKG